MIHNVIVDGADIQRVVFDRLVPALEGEAFELQVLSLITLSVLMMKPNIDFDQLQEVVMSVSEHMMLLIADSSEGVN